MLYGIVGVLKRCSQISLENACAGQSVNLKVCFIHAACTLIMKETPAHKCFSLTSEEFLRIPFFWSTPGRVHQT